MAAASSSSGPCWEYDVFLNFIGKDTGRGFVSHLNKALCKKSIKTFIDAEKLRKGDHLSELKTTIQASRVSILVFSQQYASSTWCLTELVEILECHRTKDQIVLPIFYGVDPSHVRHLRRSFAKDFTKHERDSNIDVKDVQRWRSALPEACEIYGWDSQNYNDDAELVEKVVEDVLRKINNSSTSSTDNGLVEMDSPEVEMNDVCIVGIWGMADLGEITTAGAVYFTSSYEACCFLEKFKEVFRKHGKRHMWRELLSSISNNRVGSRGSGCPELIGTWIRSSVIEQSSCPSICVCKYVASERNHEDIAMSTPFANLRTPWVLIQFG